MANMMCKSMGVHVNETSPVTDWMDMTWLKILNTKGRVQKKKSLKLQTSSEVLGPPPPPTATSDNNLKFFLTAFFNFKCCNTTKNAFLYLTNIFKNEGFNDKQQVYLNKIPSFQTTLGADTYTF